MPELDGIAATRPHRAESRARRERDRADQLRRGRQGLPAPSRPARRATCSRTSRRRTWWTPCGPRHRGEPRLHPEVARKLMEAARAGGGAQPPAAAPPGVAPDAQRPGDLTDRELEVVRLVAQGLTNHEIAGRLVDQREDGEGARESRADQARVEGPHAAGRPRASSTGSRTRRDGDGHKRGRSGRAHRGPSATSSWPCAASGSPASSPARSS